MKQHIQVTIPVSGQELREILVAQLSYAGYEAFEETDAELKAFIEQQQFDEAALKALLQLHELNFSSALLPATNWNEEWERNFQPVIVEDFCAVRASFHAPVAGVQHEIIITPKMSFGTGHHATTYMMVQLMRTIDFSEKYVFDFGTGTGILAILAEKLGAKMIVAMDNDEWSMLNAAENMTANHCSSVRLLHADNIPLTESFDIILANINKQVILDTLKQMKEKLLPGGYIMLSGLLGSDEEAVREEASKNGLSFVQQQSRGGWIAFLLRL
ncbi:MAG TPA: 50S ribosomal protein L11 methyltransferase [Chitinophagaceae bacterium]|nr:50S ribosomal protein L11 methyltransferase [Chitinophagaceae bacterium]